MICTLFVFGPRARALAPQHQLCECTKLLSALARPRTKPRFHLLNLAHESHDEQDFCVLIIGSLVLFALQVIGSISGRPVRIRHAVALCRGRLRRAQQDQDRRRQSELLAASDLISLGSHAGATL